MFVFVYFHRCCDVDAVDQMLQSDKRKSLQSVFVSEGVFDMFVGFFHKLEQDGVFLFCACVITVPSLMSCCCIDFL